MGLCTRLKMVARTWGLSRHAARTQGRIRNATVLASVAGDTSSDKLTRHSMHAGAAATAGVSWCHAWHHCRTIAVAFRPLQGALQSRRSRTLSSSMVHHDQDNPTPMHGSPIDQPAPSSRGAHASAVHVMRCAKRCDGGIEPQCLL